MRGFSGDQFGESVQQWFRLWTSELLCRSRGADYGAGTGALDVRLAPVRRFLGDQFGDFRGRTPVQRSVFDAENRLRCGTPVSASVVDGESLCGVL